MRSLAPIAIAGSLLLAAALDAQILTEHAAAAAGATIGSAAGKSISSALTNVLGQVNKQTAAAAAAPKPAKKPEPKAEPKAALAKARTADVPDAAPQASSRAPHAIRSLKNSSASADEPAPAAPHSRRSRVASAEPVFVAAPVTSEPPVREISPADVAAIQVGASSSQLQAALGAPESRVVIPGDDGKLLEICQYWAKGQPVGTVRLVNGQVESVEAAR